MKKLLLFLSSFIWALALCTNEVFAQQGWYWQNPLPQGNMASTSRQIANGREMARLASSASFRFAPPISRPNQCPLCEFECFTESNQVSSDVAVNIKTE